MIIRADLQSAAYDIVIERGALARAGEYMKLDRRCLIVTDSGVPAEYSKIVAAQAKYPVIVTLPAGESSKSLDNWQMLLRTMLAENFTRTDAVIAVGGGVVGDLAGFAAASYMRGIDFYNIPTTVLAAVDSSVGGKVAVDLDMIKNVVGAFYQPKKVLIDPDTLATLPARQIANGLAESVKMAVTSNVKLFETFERGEALDDLEYVIAESLKIKISVVQKDERESGMRRILNFGHTLAHGIEAASELSGIYHGEAVALGMLPMCAPEIRERVRGVLASLGLPTELHGDLDEIIKNAAHDKKCDGGDIYVVLSDKIGSCRTVKMSFDEWSSLVRRAACGEFI